MQDRSALTPLAHEMLDAIISRQVEEPAKEVSIEEVLFGFDGCLERACREAIVALQRAGCVTVRGQMPGELARPSALGLLCSVAYGRAVRELVERLRHYQIERLKRERRIFKFTFHELAQVGVVAGDDAFGLLVTTLELFDLRGSGTRDTPNLQDAWWDVHHDLPSRRAARTAEDLLRRVQQRAQALREAEAAQGCEDAAQPARRVAMISATAFRRELAGIEVAIREQGDRISAMTEVGADVVERLWQVLRGLQSFRAESDFNLKQLSVMLEDLWLAYVTPKLRSKLPPEIKRAILSLLAKTILGEAIRNLIERE